MKRMMIDDERFPPNDDNHWVVVRTVAEAVRYVKEFGCPEFISFDNDLQRKLEGRHFAQWLIRVDIDEDGQFIPDGFEFYVHSQNSNNGINETLNNHLNNRHRFLSPQKPKVGVKR